MDTLENYERMLREAGFVNIQSSDNTDWYREQAREEYARMNGELHEPMVAALGKDRAEHFVENWRATTVVLDNGELRTCRFRAHKPGG
jgi:phosphoethanolamine N-methyltransferase